MIKVEIPTALLLYLGSILLIFFTIWLLTHLRNRKKTAYTAPEILTTCEYCLFPYLATQGEPISQCPQCQSMNKQT